MKKLLTATALMFVMALPMAASAAEKIAVVDMAKVMHEIPQRAAISQALNKEFADRIEELKGLEDQMNKLMEDQKRNAQLMSDEQKRESQRKLESLDANYQLKLKAFKQDSKARQAEEQNKLLVKIQDSITKIAKDNGFDMVLTGQAALYAKPDTDISDKVIKSLSGK